MTSVSWFAGIGGFDAAMLAAGHEVIGACEIDESAREVYAARSGEPRWFSRDIREVRPEEIPDADLWCGGFPCQDASVAGKRAGAGEGTRTGLWWPWQRLMAARRPAIVLAENVPGLLSVNGGRDFGAILASLLAIGYRIAWTVLDARYFGVAQRRRRVFILASLGRDPREVLFDPGTAPLSLGPPAAVLIDGHWQSLQMVLMGAADSPFEGGAWPGSGYAVGDRCWTRDVPEWRRTPVRASLAETLETGPIPARFYLSPKACAGILRRAARRGRELPAALESALSVVALRGRGNGACAEARADDTANALRTPGGGSSQQFLVFGGNRTSGPRSEASALSAHGGASGRLDFETESFVVGPIQAQGAGGRGHRIDAEAAAGGHLIADGDCAARSDGGDALVVGFYPTAGGRSVQATDDGSPAIKVGKRADFGGTPPAVLIAGQQHGSDVGAMGALRAGHGDVQSGVPFVVHAAESGAKERHAYETDHARCLDGTGGFASAQGGTIVAFGSKDDGRDATEGVSPTLRAAGHDASHANAGAPPAVAQVGSVRRLTATECERLQNFPDGWTCMCGCASYSTAACTCPDGPRYKMLGNAVCVAVVRWIAERLP